MKNERIFITGGSGFLGKHLAKRLYKDNEITIYSRDESKHYYMQKEYPSINFVVGDIRNIDLLKRKSEGHTVGIFAASMKQIDACSKNHEEAAKIIIDGAFNSRIVAEANNFKSACFISSDKSRAATTIYGAMKYVAGEGFIVGDSPCKLTTIIYGNVANSTGSIIPLMWNCIKSKRKLVLYGESMTRFWIDIDEAVDLILKSTKYSGVNIIPVIRSFSVKDLVEIFHEQFDLEYSIGELRIGEKNHEIMASSEEIRRMEYVPEDKLYILHPEKNVGILSFNNQEYSSRDCVMSKKELLSLLVQKDFYK